MNKLVRCPALEPFNSPLSHCLPLWTAVRLPGKKLQNARKQCSVVQLLRLCNIYRELVKFIVYIHYLLQKNIVFGLNEEKLVCHIRDIEQKRVCGHNNNKLAF